MPTSAQPSRRGKNAFFLLDAVVGAALVITLLVGVIQAITSFHILLQKQSERVGLYLEKISVNSLEDHL